MVSKKTWVGLGLVSLAAVIAVGCASGAGTISEESLGLRKTNLYVEKADTVGEVTAYGKAAAGSSKLFERAFENAPPMIPHDVDGMLPITINNNQCISCHAPEVASSVGALPYPKSHMINFRPNSRAIAGANTSSEDMKDVKITSLNKLSGSRFNCSQCHAPQSQMEAPKNTFKAEFTSKDGARKSAWSGEKLTEGLDTLSH